MFEDESSTPKKVSSFNMKSNIQQGNTRKIGKRVTVSLIKGPHGLGFSITTRDNHLGGEALVYIKSILTKVKDIYENMTFPWYIILNWLLLAFQFSLFKQKFI